MFSFLQPVGFPLLLQQVLLGDLELFGLRVARNPDDLHAVLQRPRNPVERIRRGNEHHLRQVVIAVEIVIVEGAVLLGIEHFEQRRRRIAAEVGRHLVDFVQQHHGVGGSRLAHPLDHFAGQRADIGAPMAADFGLVAHAAERHADELAAGRARDRLAERSLADARRSDQAEDRSLQLADEGLDRQILEDALFHLIQAVMVFFKDALGFLDVELVFGVLEPRQRQEPVEIVAHDGRFGRHRRHHLELLDLALALLASLGRHLLLAQFLFQFLNLVLELVLLAELLLNRAHLLVEVVLLLGLLHLLLDPGADALFDLEDFQLRAHVAEDLLQPLGRIGRFEQRLLVFELDAEMTDQLVGEIRGIVDRRDRGDHLGRNLLVQADIVVEGGDDRAHQRFDFGRAVADFLDLFDFDLEKFFVGQRSGSCARASCLRPAP